MVIDLIYAVLRLSALVTALALAALLYLKGGWDAAGDGGSAPRRR